jgi:23S rRNA (guanosine2251-2'-O)-methyltransferase
MRPPRSPRSFDRNRRPSHQRPHAVEHTPPDAPERGAAEPGSHVVYGVHAVTELLLRRRDDLHMLMVQRDGREGPEDGPQQGAGSALAQLCRRARELGVQPIERSRAELDRVTHGGVHQGVVALCGAFRYAEGTAALLANAQARGEAPLLLVLDGVQDPQNLGALVRSTYVLGGHGVVVPQDRAASVTPAAVKASAGATELLPIAQVPNLVRAMNDLQEAGVWLAAAVAPGQDGRPPWELDLTQPIALVLGGEGRGLRPLSRKTCELRVEIPMQPGLHGASLNVAAAGAVLLYEVLRQRRAART